jgi:hypothetical protein
LVAAPLAARAGETNDTPPPASTLSITATPNPVGSGATTRISGHLEAYLTILAVIKLEESPAPFTAGFHETATTMTDEAGNYAFNGVRPTAGTRYRARSVFPITASDSLLVRFSRRVALRLSDRTPATGQAVRFRGTVTPAFAGGVVQIQRRGRKGKFRVVARARLKGAVGFSTYSRRLRLRRSGVFRARVAGDPDHAPATSARRRARVHKSSKVHLAASKAASARAASSRGAKGFLT